MTTIKRYLQNRRIADQIIREQVRSGRINTGPRVDYDLVAAWLNEG